jgi:hypothetical protein
MQSRRIFMAFLIFALSLALMIAGLASGYMSLDLLPTGPGLLYALGGAVAVSVAVIAFALGVAIRRIDALIELVRRQAEAGEGAAEAAAADDGFVAPAAASERNAEEAEAQGATSEAGEPAAEEDGAPINENRSGRLPTLPAKGHAAETPEAPPQLVGRYSSGGANYMIFADGSIEAETQEGAFRFASMGDFKRYLADRAANR